MTFRYYDPSAGRFLNRDPIGHNGGANEYEYVSNGPVGSSNPSGLLPGSPWEAILESIGATAGACIGAFLGNLSNSDPCNSRYNICMQWVERIADAFSAAAGAFVLAYCPVSGFWIGCLEGVISAALHTLTEHVCDAYFSDPCHHESGLGCQIASNFVDVALGCLDGWAGKGLSELEEGLGQWKQFLEGELEFVIALFSNASEASNCFGHG